MGIPETNRCAKCGDVKIAMKKCPRCAERSEAVMGEWVVTDKMLRANPSNVLALADKHGSVRVVSANGETVQRIVVHQEDEPARTRKLVGYRVVRVRDGVREWLSSGNRWYPSLSFCQHWPPAADVPWLRGRAKRFGGRVCKVFLSYGRGR